MRENKVNLENLFSRGRIGNTHIKNRIVRSATFTRLASKEGFVTDHLIDFYSDLARGGTGLIITGFIAVEIGHTVSPGGLCLYDDKYIPEHKKLVKAVHDYSDVKIAAQLAHTGRQGTHPKYQPVAPSPLADKIIKRTPRELTTAEVWETINYFVRAGIRAYESGYDMVQLHGAHGYLLSNFLSPYANKRNDEFGGNTKKRTKIVVEIHKQLKDELGKEFPIIIKLQVNDFISGGLSLEEGKKISKIIVETGFMAIEPSGGSAETLFGKGKRYPSLMIKKPEDENYFLPIVTELKPIIKKCSIFLMGGVRNPVTAEQFLRDKLIDFISMSRPLIYEPDLPNRWRNGDFSPPLCTNCNNCYLTISSGPVHCTVKKRRENKKKK